MIVFGLVSLGLAYQNWRTDGRVARFLFPLMSRRWPVRRYKMWGTPYLVFLGVMGLITGSAMIINY